MREKTIRLGLVWLVAACVTTMGTQGAVLAAEATEQQDCRSIEDDALRLACYDGRALPPKPVESPQPAPPPQPVEATQRTEPAQRKEPPAPAATKASATPAAERVEAEPVPLDDEIGKESLRQEKKDEVVVRGTVVRCVEDATSKYLFYFDNGQVWQQRDNTRIRWDECAFDVTISKDFFGYKMVRDGEKRKVRIGRVK